MTDLIRWNTGFIRGLAQGILDRAKTIRTSLAGPIVAAKPSKKRKKASPRKSSPKGKVKGRTNKKTNA